MNFELKLPNSHHVFYDEQIFMKQQVLIHSTYPKKQLQPTVEEFLGGLFFENKRLQLY